MKKYNILMKKKIILFFYFISFQEKTTSIKIRELLENSNTPKKRSSLDDTACLPSNFTTEKVPVFAIRSTCTKDKFTYLHVLWYFFPFTSLLFSLQVGYTIVEKVTNTVFDEAMSILTKTGIFLCRSKAIDRRFYSSV